MVHRDIKPANILITPKGHVKITDFGLATWRGASQLTKEGTTVGTAAYMAPEQIQGKKTDPRSDLFSLGVVLYELIARRRPFQGEHDAAISYAITNEIPEPLQRYKSGVHPGLEQVVARSLEKDPSTRYQSASDMLAELKRIKRETEGSQPSMLSRTMTAAPAPKEQATSKVKYVVASSVVLVAVLVIFLLKPFKFDVVPEQRATAADNSLAVMYFENLSDPLDADKTGEMAANLLITGLSESQFLRVLSRQRLYDILNSLGKPEVTKIGPTTSTEIAAKANVKWIVTGKVYQTSPRMVLSADVSESDNGEIVTTQRISGEPGEDLFAVIDKLGAALRNNIALPAAAKTEETKSVAEVTTHSSDAYRYYLEGVDYKNKFYSKEAIESFQKALPYDSTYAMAYYQLATVPSIRYFTDAPTHLGWRAKAEKYAANSSWKDQQYINAAAEQWRNNLSAYAEELERIIERYPDEKDAWQLKGGLSTQTGRFQDAVNCYRHIVELDPADKNAYNRLAYAFNTVGKFDSAIWAINHYIELAPDEPNPYDSRGDLYAYNGRTEEAIDSYRLAMQKSSEFSSETKLWYMYLYSGDFVRADSVCQAMAGSSDRTTRAFGRNALPRVAAYQGQFRKALSQFDEAISADRLERFEGTSYFNKLGGRASVLRALGRLDEAVVAAELQAASLKRADSTSLTSGTMALYYCEVGRFDDARRAIDADRSRLLAREDTTDWEKNKRGLVAYGDGRFDEAISEFERIDANNRWAPLVAHLVQAYLKKGKLEKAVSELERFLTYQSGSRASAAYDGVRCFYWLGLAYEQSGWKDKAAKQYQTFLDIWKDADPGIPEIDDARKRLAALSS